jgi:hypothetical protein
MTRWYVERIRITKPSDIPKDIVYHLYARMSSGKALVLIEKPFLFMRIVKKAWFRLHKSLERERSVTMDRQLIMGIERQIETMDALKFIAALPSDAPNGDVFFIDPSRIPRLPYDCRTIYICTPLAGSQVEELKASLPDGCVVVEYHLEAMVNPVDASYNSIHDHAQPQ